VRRRRLRHADPPERVAAAWLRACRAASLAGVSGTPAMTSSEWARETANSIPIAARPMASLAESVDLVEFSPPEAFAGRAERLATLTSECELWSKQIHEIATDTLSTTQRAREYFANWN
jgi:hypothetical protein